MHRQVYYDEYCRNHAEASRERYGSTPASEQELRRWNSTTRARSSVGMRELGTQSRRGQARQHCKMLRRGSREDLEDRGRVEECRVGVFPTCRYQERNYGGTGIAWSGRGTAEDRDGAESGTRRSATCTSSSASSSGHASAVTSTRAGRNERGWPEINPGAWTASSGWRRG